MTKTQIAALAATAAFFGTAAFTASEWEKSPAYGKIALYTAYKNGAIIAHKTTTTSRTYYTTAELVEMLNDCAGEDCYNCNWHLQVDEEGRAYEEETTTTTTYTFA